MSYRAYQQVLRLDNKEAKTSRKIRGVKKPSGGCKKRSRSGCLTCRRRKKKCDEHVINGKCEGCSRNFLACCWPTDGAKTVSSPEATASEGSAPSCDSSPAASPCLSPKSPCSEATPGSPGSPSLASMGQFALPKNYSYKLQSERSSSSVPKSMSQPTFIVTSLAADTGLYSVPT
ncbi:Piso0_002799 [Millerozyma farinosa CBS 7064]|uniref:Piso0_002799 protein n=1 Tax=Pichia sorbitophila (strain ATCC MYA-4447 / BCRC 22081 / CBS 7064 / NBRC 10061 / NRRL Y-12695) TaxID=559304 RepID=G8YG03_PICSO|nr:Piso0_002799 [Millerozyma farinosa CBS 7064]